MPDKKFVPCSTIVSKAATLICPSLVFSNYLSQPILALGKSKLLAAFLIGRGEVVNPEVGYRIWPPKLLAIFNVHDGKFEELRAVTPREFSRVDDPEKPFFAGVSPAEKSEVEFLDKQARLFESFDDLAQRLIAIDSYQQELKSYDDNYKILSEAALIPYYGKILLKPINRA